MSDVRSKPSPAWQRLMDARGLGSYRRLADKAGLSHETARRVVMGRSSTPESVRAIARALGVDVELVRAMRDEPEDVGGWSPPPSAVLLTRDEREVLSRLIGVMTQGREAVVGDGNTAPIDVDEDPDPSTGGEPAAVPPSAEGRRARRGPSVSRIEGHGPSRTSTFEPKDRGRRRSGGSRPS